MSGSTDGETRKQGRAIKRKIRMLRPRHGRMLMRPVHLQENLPKARVFLHIPAGFQKSENFLNGHRTP